MIPKKKISLHIPHTKLQLQCDRHSPGTSVCNLRNNGPLPEGPPTRCSPVSGSNHIATGSRPSTIRRPSPPPPSEPTPPPPLQPPLTPGVNARALHARAASSMPRMYSPAGLCKPPSESCRFANSGGQTLALVPLAGCESSCSSARRRVLKTPAVSLLLTLSWSL